MESPLFFRVTKHKCVYISCGQGALGRAARSMRHMAEQAFSSLPPGLQSHGASIRVADVNRLGYVEIRVRNALARARPNDCVYFACSGPKLYQATLRRIALLAGPISSMERSG